GSTTKLIVPGGVPVTNGIVSPTILGQNTDTTADFLTHDTTNGFRVATYTSTDITTSAATDVVNQTTSPAAPLSAAAQAYALKVGSGVTIDTGAQSLTLGNNAGQAGLILTGGASINSSGGTPGPVVFGGAEAIIHVNAASTISAPITSTVAANSNALTVLGPGTLTLTGSNTIAGNIVVGSGATLAINGPGGTSVAPALGGLTPLSITLRGDT